MNALPSLEQLDLDILYNELQRSSRKTGTWDGAVLRGMLPPHDLSWKQLGEQRATLVAKIKSVYAAFGLTPIYSGKGRLRWRDLAQIDQTKDFIEVIVQDGRRLGFSWNLGISRGWFGTCAYYCDTKSTP